MFSKKPMLMWIDGKCFELKNYGGFKSRQTIKEIISKKEFTERLSSDFEFFAEESGHHSTNFRLPPLYCIKLHEQQFSTIKLLETETNTNIYIPRDGKKSIKISSAQTEGIVTARHFIHSLVGSIREQSRPSQFISIPVRSEEITEKFTNFRDEILNGEPIEGMHESIFQDVKKLHLTIVVFALLDNNETSEAIKTLNDYKTNILDPTINEIGSLKMNIKGIDCMENNPAKVNVLYANVEIVDENETKRLQEIANGISDYFYNRGLVIQYKDNVKLHVTLINTKYRKTSSNPSTPNKKNKRYVKKQPFDARKILEKYEDYHFGTCNFDSIHLSLMTSKGEDGFYKPLAVINL